MEPRDYYSYSICAGNPSYTVGYKWNACGKEICGRKTNCANYDKLYTNLVNDAVVRAKDNIATTLPCSMQSDAEQIKDKENRECEMRQRSYILPHPKKIIYNNPATIVFWKDGTKTVVKCENGTEFSEYYGYLAAVGKKIHGTNGAIRRTIEKVKTVQEKKSNPEPEIMDTDWDEA